jgi:hypothetical protein
MLRTRRGAALPRLLVSLCNVGPPRRSALLMVERDQVAVVDLGRPAPDVTTGVGLSRQGDRVLHLYRTDVTRLTVLDAATLEVVADYALPEVEDPHSLVLHRGRLVVPSTGTDQVLAYPWTSSGPGAPEVVWAASEAGRDTHHVNAVAVVDGHLLLTAFGPKTGERHSTATQGYVLDLTTGVRILEGIHHPHSVVAKGRGGLVCDSSRSRVLTLEGREVARSEGYVRGLSVVGRQLYVGSSVGRKESKSQSGVSNPADPGVPVGRCQVRRFGPGRQRPDVDLSEYGDEIYDLLALP